MAEIKIERFTEMKYVHLEWLMSQQIISGQFMGLFFNFCHPIINDWWAKILARNPYKKYEKY